MKGFNPTFCRSLRNTKASFCISLVLLQNKKGVFQTAGIIWINALRRLEKSVPGFVWLTTKQKGANFCRETVAAGLLR